MNKKIITICACLVFLVSFNLASNTESYIEQYPWPITSFTEIWGYLSPADASLLDRTWPITDIGLFSASLSSTGKLIGIPSRNSVKTFNGRVHLVVAEVSNRALTHFCLSPEYPVRAQLITDIIEASKPFSGVQIDFEQILDADAEHFVSFLKEIKKGIGSKTLSVALPARTRKVQDAFDYDKVGAVADRIIVMAYDEHWSGSKPGPIASFDWGERVAQYSLSRLGKEKLVMGLPFYGRAWADVNPAKAYRHSSLQTLIAEQPNALFSRLAGVPSFTYEQKVNVSVFFEDGLSIAERASLYKKNSVDKIGFWKIGQEAPSVWSYLRIEK